MSWSGFMKTVNRAGTTILQKTGQVDRTVDREFMEEQERYKIFEKNANNLHKETKAFLDALRAMSSSQVRIAETIEHFYSDSSDQAMAGHAYKRAVEELDLSGTKELDGPYRTTVLEPVGKLCSYFPEINNSIQKRHKKLLDYDSARSKARKMAEKPSDDPTKLPKAEKESDEARQVFETINLQLSSELPQFLDLRVPYLDPSFEAMVRMQLKFAEEGYEKLSGVQRYLEEKVREEYAEGRLDAQVEGALQEMRDLSCCGFA